MKVLKTILAMVCLMCIFIVPADGAPMAVYFIWVPVALCAVYALYRLCKSDGQQA